MLNEAQTTSLPNSNGRRTNQLIAMGTERKYDLEDRLVAFACIVVPFVDHVPNTVAGRHLGGQLIRSGTAPGLHYGEAQSAESRADFLHKMKLALKELRESRVNLRILVGSKLITADDRQYAWLRGECDELIAIMAKGISTAEKNKDG